MGRSPAIPAASRRRPGRRAAGSGPCSQPSTLGARITHLGSRISTNMAGIAPAYSSVFGHCPIHVNKKGRGDTGPPPKGVWNPDVVQAVAEPRPKDVANPLCEVPPLPRRYGVRDFRPRLTPLGRGCPQGCGTYARFPCMGSRLTGTASGSCPWAVSGPRVCLASPWPGRDGVVVLHRWGVRTLHLPHLRRVFPVVVLGSAVGGIDLIVFLPAVGRPLSPFLVLGTPARGPRSLRIQSLDSSATSINKCGTVPAF